MRLLVGSKLNLQMNCPEVVVSILSERQCKDLVQGKKLEEIGNCGEILNGNCVMEHNKDRTVLQVYLIPFKFSILLIFALRGGGEN